MTNIESKSYVATPSDIAKLAGDIIDNTQRVESGRGTYLKALVATTRAALGAEPRQRNGRAERLDAEAIAEHLKALDAVHLSFYAAVLQVAQNTVPDPDKALIRSRTRFAVSAASTLRGFIRAGNDVRALAAHKVTKAALATPRTRRKLTVEALSKRATKLASELETIARNLNAANRQIAHDVLAPVLARLAEASGATANATKDHDKAVAENLPFHTRTGVFVPISLSAAREARKAA